MKTVESQEINKVAIHLKEARNGMERLMTLSEDWTAKVEVQCEFDHLEQRWNRFAQHQLGLLTEWEVSD